jgi:hypothetical protein
MNYFYKVERFNIQPRAIAETGMPTRVWLSSRGLALRCRVISEHSGRYARIVVLTATEARLGPLTRWEPSHGAVTGSGRELDLI